MLEFGGTAEDVEASYGVEDVNWTLARINLAEHFHWSMHDIDEMSMDDMHRSLAYLRAIERIRGAAKTAKGKR